MHAGDVDDLTNVSQYSWMSQFFLTVLNTDNSVSRRADWQVDLFLKTSQKPNRSARQSLGAVPVGGSVGLGKLGKVKAGTEVGLLPKP